MRYSVSDMSVAKMHLRVRLRFRAGEQKRRTCDLIWKYGVQDLPLFDLVLAAHVEELQSDASVQVLALIALPPYHGVDNDGK
jgi:hypothetical protein